MLIAHEIDDTTYEVRDGDVVVFTVRQGDPGVTPNGNRLDNKWTMRDVDGKLIDWDRYRNDLFPRNGIEPADDNSENTPPPFGMR